MPYESSVITICCGSKSRKVSIVRADLAKHKVDEQGRKLWWFGSDPPSGIPSPKMLINSIQQARLREFAPPWAAVLEGLEEEGVWVCTDPIGLQHIFLRESGEHVIVGPDALEIAAFGPVHLDPIGAYELISRGNPQCGRTLFSEVKCLSPSTLIQLDLPLRIVSYWSLPDPSPIDHNSVIDVYANAVKSAVVRHWRNEDIQELTAGRDSMMILAALLSEGMPVRTWTHGCHEDPDMVGAQERALKLGVSHEPVFLEPLQNIDADEGMRLVKYFLKASSGLANVLEYWHLPWVINQISGRGTITGVGGEVFRGFYYQWAGKGMIPRSLGRWFLLRGKIREMMPLANPIVRDELAKEGDRVIKADLKRALRPGPCYWHSLDAYYLMHRMHHFAGSTFSATQRWRTVRMPLFDPTVIDCLPLIPIALRQWSSGLVREVTGRLLKHKFSQKKFSYSYETLSYRIARLIKRKGELRGTIFKGWQEALSRLIVNSEKAKCLLNTSKMVTSDLYNKDILAYYTDTIKEGRPVPVFLGAVLTIELAAREIGSAFSGIDRTILDL